MIWNRFRAAGAAAMLVFALGGTSPAVPAPEGNAPTAADFGALPFLTDPVLSRDGQYVAAQGLVKGKQVVVIADISAPGTKLSTFPIPDQHQLEWVRWAGSRRLIVSISRAGTLMGDEVRITRLASIDLDTGKIALIGPRQQGVIGDDVVHIDREGHFLLLSTQPTIFDYPAVYRVDLDTGKSSSVVQPHEYVWDWYADTSGVVRAGVGSDGKNWWMIYRADEKGRFLRTIRRDVRKDADGNIGSFAMTLGSDTGYAVAASERGRFALYRYDFKADELGELLYENPDVDIDDFTLARDGTLLGVSYTDDRAQVNWFDPELKALQARIDRALPGSINSIASVTEDKQRMLVYAESATNPGTYFLYDRPSKSMSMFAQSHEALRDKQLAEMKPVRYKARDGLEIRAYLTLPPGKESAKGLPLVVMPHGGPYARDVWGYDSWVQYLASRGYAVLQPNFRGSTGFGVDFVEAGTGAWGRGMQDDVDDGVHWLAASGIADAKRVCIMGASYGGYAAEWAAIRNPELYRCAISFAGVSDIESQLKFSRKSFSAPRYFRDWRERVQGDAGFDLNGISPLRQVDRMTVPILIAHGTEDDTVPFSQSRKLHDALVKLGRAHEYVVYEGEAHGFASPENSTDFLQRVGAFLEKHNPPGG